MESIIVEKNDILERLLMSGEMESVVRRIIRKELAAAESRAEIGVRASLVNDSHEAYKAVMNSVYNRVLGGSLSILNRRKRSGAVASVPPSTRGRGGGTERLMSYTGEDRGFILRFINSGTKQRFVQNLNGRKITRSSVCARTDTRSYKGGVGNRGSIAARNFFGKVASKELELASQKISATIEAEFNKIISKS